MKTGIYLVLGTALISGIANYVNKFGLAAVAKDAYQYTALKNIVVALILSVAVLTPFAWSKLKQLSRSDWLKLVLIGLIGGSLPFLLFFKGLSLTSPVSAAFIHKTLFVWVAVLAVPVLKEKLTRHQLLAVAVLILGNLVFLNVQSLSWGLAETLILVATMLWAMENILVKLVLKRIDVLVAAWARMFFGSCFLIVFLGATHNTQQLLSLNWHQLSWLMGVGILLTGYVITWYAAVKRLPVTVAASILTLASPITSLLSSFQTGQVASWEIIVGSLMIIFGSWIIYAFRSKKEYDWQPVAS